VRPQPATHKVDFSGGFLERGFWLYVWEVTPPKGKKLYYVGRTGDSSSPRAASPYQRMGQHLGRMKNQNALRRHLESRGIAPERCRRFRFVTRGPIRSDASGDEAQHDSRLAVVGPLEMALIKAMKVSYGKDVVLNKIDDCGTEPNRRLFERVRNTFAVQFPKLRRGGPGPTRATSK